MRTKGTVLTALLAIGAFSGLAYGQPCAQLWGDIDVEAQTGETGNLGVAYLDDQYYVSYRASVTPPHKVGIFDADGVLVTTFDQHPTAQGSSWGYRDGATDGTYIYFGEEANLYRHNADGTGAIVQIAGPAPGGVATWRALAYDPDGDGGLGSFWVCNFGSAIVEVSMTGALLTTFPAGGWSLYGLAVDPDTGNLWGHDNDGSPMIVEIDKTTGLLTGVSCYTADAGEAQGGLSGVPGGYGYGGNFDLVALIQITPDTLRGFHTPLYRCVGDVDDNGVVDVLDLLAVIADWGQSGVPADVNEDGIVDVLDLLLIIANWGPCPAQPMGACCFWPSGDCLDLSQLDCIDAGGASWYPGEECATFQCPAPTPGDDCAEPFPVTLDVASLPYTNSSYTCDRGNYYMDTCLGSYDGGEDMIYELTVTESMLVDITLDPLGTTWTGIAIDVVCPPGDPCMASSTYSGGTAHGMTDIALAPGVYYIMVDTWPAPDCIPAFDLTISGGPVPDGACCTYPGPMCEDLNQAECAAAGGTFYEGETCATFTCPACNYCDVCYTNTTDDWITNVTFNTINNDSGQDGPCSYGNYVAQSTDIQVGQMYTISVTFFSAGYTECVAVWIDWNQDCEFDNITERYDLGCGADTTLTWPITVPMDAAAGSTRMRVMEKYYSAPIDACTGGSYGETEDYTVNVIVPPPKK